MKTPLLSVENVAVVYQQSILALQGVSLNVFESEIVAVLGTNGSGKTTTLRAISGFIGLDKARVSAGKICFGDIPIQNLRPDQITNKGIVLIPEREKVFPNLTVLENLEVSSSTRSSSTLGKSLAFEAFPRLKELQKRQAGLLSGGERQMLAIGAALICNPKLLLIDELSLGLAPVIVDELLTKLLELRSKLGLTIVLVEQNVSIALKISDRAYVLDNGRVVLSGKSLELERNSDIQEIYLPSRTVEYSQ